METPVVLASANAHKLHELQALLPEVLQLIGLKEAGIDFDLPETSGSFKGNALEKASTITRLKGLPALADDSGLVIEGLDGLPGVDSAHFSGKRDDAANREKVLELLADKKERAAYFICIICFTRPNHEPLFFEGKVYGTISKTASGSGGFGYDPIFIPTGYSETFAQLSAETKNNISHRSRAVSAFVEWLKANPL